MNGQEPVGELQDNEGHRRTYTRAALHQARLPGAVGQLVFEQPSMDPAKVIFPGASSNLEQSLGAIVVGVVRKVVEIPVVLFEVDNALADLDA